MIETSWFLNQEIYSHRCLWINIMYFWIPKTKTDRQTDIIEFIDVFWPTNWGKKSKKAVCVAAFGSFDQTSNTLSHSLTVSSPNTSSSSNKIFLYFVVVVVYFIFCSSSHSFHNTLIVWKYAELPVVCKFFSFFFCLIFCYYYFFYLRCHFIWNDLK